MLGLWEAMIIVFQQWCDGILEPQSEQKEGDIKLETYQYLGALVSFDYDHDL